MAGGSRLRDLPALYRAVRDDADVGRPQEPVPTGLCSCGGTLRPLGDTAAKSPAASLGQCGVLRCDRCGAVDAGGPAVARLMGLAGCAPLPARRRGRS